MTSTPQRWDSLYSQIPLCDVRRHYAGIGQSPFMLQYLSTVLRLCPRGGRTCETGIGNGFGAIWLSRRGVLAEGMDLSPQLVDRGQLLDCPAARAGRSRTGVGRSRQGSARLDCSGSAVGTADAPENENAWFCVLLSDGRSGNLRSYSPAGGGADGPGTEGTASVNAGAKTAAASERARWRSEGEQL